MWSTVPKREPHVCGPIWCFKAWDTATRALFIPFFFTTVFALLRAILDFGVRTCFETHCMQIYIFNVSKYFDLGNGTMARRHRGRTHTPGHTCTRICMYVHIREPLINDLERPFAVLSGTRSALAREQDTQSVRNSSRDCRTQRSRRSGAVSGMVSPMMSTITKKIRNRIRSRGHRSTQVPATAAGVRKLSSPCRRDPVQE